MTARILDGNALAAKVREHLAAGAATLKATRGITPCLAVILVGEDPASSVYVRNKVAACEKAGFRSIRETYPANVEPVVVLAKIAELNADPAVHGILVQMPVPKHIDPQAVILRIDPTKDVDGFHPYNIGRLAIRQPTLRSCTPFGVIKMLRASNIDLMGLDAVIVGVSNNVGRPMALELLLAGCTVTSCHRHTKNLAEKIKGADLVVAAAGKAGLIHGDWIKPGAIVIDIGINRREDGTICGDVDFNVAKQRASHITPVPGGVGPMTVATLMENTLLALELSEAHT